MLISLQRDSEVLNALVRRPALSFKCYYRALVRNKIAASLDKKFGRMIRALQNCMQLFVGNYRAVLNSELRKGDGVVLRLPKSRKALIRTAPKRTQPRNVVPGDRCEVSRLS